MIKRGDGGTGPPPPALPPTGLGRLRKIAIIGSAETVEFAPWYDPTWEIWSHAITYGRCKRVDRIFELHPEHVWREHTKPQWPTYLAWLQKCPYPIYMLEHHQDIPKSIRYPRERIFGECRSMIGRLHFGSQADFMIALALSEGVTHLGLFGVQYTAFVQDGVTRVSEEMLVRVEDELARWEAAILRCEGELTGTIAFADLPDPRTRIVVSVARLDGMESVDVNFPAARMQIEYDPSRVNADLIAAGSHGAGFFGRIVIGSVSSKLVHGTRASLLLTPPADVPDELQVGLNEAEVLSDLGTAAELLPNRAG